MSFTRTLFVFLVVLLLIGVESEARWDRNRNRNRNRRPTSLYQHQQMRQHELAELRKQQLMRSNNWSQLESELQHEFESGLGEDELASLEQSTVSQQGTQCLLQQPRTCDTSQTVRVTMDISIDVGMANSQPQIGRMTFDLFNNTAPRTVHNFVTICSGSQRGLTYRGNKFHRIIGGFMAQGGDIERGDGRGGRSIYGRNFADETFACRHVCRGSLSMANSGRDTNGSQFFFTFASTPWLDGKHVVFGQVTDGWETVQLMENVGTESGQPTAAVTIMRCSVH